MARRLIDRIVYAITKKPKHYVEVKNPPLTVLEKMARPQDARQMQYNIWCRRYHIYSGSYLPDKPTKLYKKGWEMKRQRTNDTVVIQRKSTGQTIRSETHGDAHHYHWLDYWEIPFSHPRFRKVEGQGYRHQLVYFDKYGQLVSRNDENHHIWPTKDK